jgi:hypothetical protein
MNTLPKVVFSSTLTDVRACGVPLRPRRLDAHELHVAPEPALQRGDVRP